LTLQEKKRVNHAIDRGIKYVRSKQADTGTWFDPPKRLDVVGGVPRTWPVGFAALPGLTLLECGVAPEDPAVQKAVRFVRKHVPSLNRTYEISLAILFLDRLGEPGDRPLIRSLALRLAAGQNNLGGWGYTCPILKPKQEEKVLETLRQQNLAKEPKKAILPQKKGAKALIQDLGDNSNTQFAILGLGVARKHNLPLDYTLARIEQRFRFAQAPNGGWGYKIRLPDKGSMTCVGLLGLAIGRGSVPEGSNLDGPKAIDEGIARGLQALGGHLVSVDRSKGKLDLYFLWSVERVGELCSLKTIGGKDWYRWGVELLLPAQNPNGSWFGQISRTSPTIDTCFALLFLKRSDLLPDLRETLQKRLKITDPGLDKSISPGEKSKPKSGTKSPGEIREKEPQLKDGIRRKEGGDKVRFPRAVFGVNDPAPCETPYTVAARARWCSWAGNRGPGRSIDPA
jgi:hypothetical protein